MEIKKEANRKRALAWYHRNKEKCLARQKKWRESEHGKEWLSEWWTKYKSSGELSRASKERYDRDKQKSREIGRIKYHKHRDRCSERMKRWASSENGKKYLAAYREKELNEGKTPARYALRNAIRRGDVIRKCCEVCGFTESQAHHKDYTKPLDIVWLCEKHHKELHRNNR